MKSIVQIKKLRFQLVLMIVAVNVFFCTPVRASFTYLEVSQTASSSPKINNNGEIIWGVDNGIFQSTTRGTISVSTPFARGPNINDKGEIVYYGGFQGWEAYSLTQGALGGGDTSVSVNNNGQIAWAWNQAYPRQLKSSTGGVIGQITTNEPFYNPMITSVDINDSGEIIYTTQEGNHSYQLCSTTRGLLLSSDSSIGSASLSNAGAVIYSKAYLRSNSIYSLDGTKIIDFANPLDPNFRIGGGFDANDRRDIVFTAFGTGWSRTILATNNPELYPSFSSIDPALITPTPIPAAAWLFGSGLMGLFGLRRKKSNIPCIVYQEPK